MQKFYSLSWKHCKTIKKCAIPPELVLNSDQTPSSYASVGRSTMASRGAKTVAIKGYTDKRNITLNFVVTLAGEFLPMQIEKLKQASHVV